ncbi:hypothetical protein AG1IA_03843 [Rhizoctonia solani AG-1 IA]|uniref:Uncharacterized protein n=1 Tax=Thanatephorus cucumeris (strain AG1-IA) TaxID=983506 RepID=L8WVI3_THACA|nr:hypothetical protein AG1IA_03843 [Rhizoctonia solani AG-1 IA]
MCAGGTGRAGAGRGGCVYIAAGAVGGGGGGNTTGKGAAEPAWVLPLDRVGALRFLDVVLARGAMICDVVAAARWLNGGAAPTRGVCEPDGTEVVRVSERAVTGTSASSIRRR